jgi:DNA-binding LacI/PurR family transcriptional regulator
LGSTEFSLEAAKCYFKLHGLPEGVTAVCTGNDLMALGVLQWAYEAGLRIPEDLSLVGYDDSILARVTSPKLTSIHQQSYRSGELLVEELLKQIEGQKEPKTVYLNSSLMKRESTGPVPR